MYIWARTYIHHVSANSFLLWQQPIRAAWTSGYAIKTRNTSVTNAVIESVAKSTEHKGLTWNFLPLWWSVTLLPNRGLM